VASPSLAWLDGAWIRHSRSLGGGLPTECSDVVWLQWGRWFADFRLPRPGRQAVDQFDVAHAFSGRLAVTEAGDPVGPGATVLWHHDLDTAPPPGGEPDGGQLTVRGELLVETGDGYIEWWQRPEGRPPVSPALVLERRGPAGGGTDHGAVVARTVCVDGMAVAVWAGEPGGGAWCSAESGWQPGRLVGAPPDALGIVEALQAAVDGGRLPEAWQLGADR
jgi:hypothetical protein